MTVALVCAIIAQVVPLTGQEQQSNGVHVDSTLIRVITEDSASAFLHVFVETSYGWFWQSSTGKAYTTADKEGKQRIRVDKLCLTLVAHDSITKCVEHADSIVVKSKKRGPGIKKRIARVTAWSEGPALGPESMEMKP